MVNKRRAAREKAGYTPQQAARIAGVMLSTFRQYESGGKVSYHRAVRLCQAYGCDFKIFIHAAYNH